VVLSRVETSVETAIALFVFYQARRPLRQSVGICFVPVHSRWQSRECHLNRLEQVSPKEKAPGELNTTTVFNKALALDPTYRRSAMNRRQFLRNGLAGGGILLAAGGFAVLRRNQARSALTSRMLDDALQPLVENSLHELNTLPQEAREEIRHYFHGKCLNAGGFVTQICSNEFVEQLGRCQDSKEREVCFLQAFCSRIATETEILNRVETIAAEVGNKLDLAWANYCVNISARWNTCIAGYGRPFAMDELSDRLGGMIRSELGQVARQDTLGNRRPAVGETIGKIGASAILLAPLVRFGQVGLAVGIPVFIVLAAKHLWDYVTGLLHDRRGEYQAAISGQLALLGNRVGTEFERDVRQRLTDLHIWQERSIRQLATSLAEERVGLIEGFK
jgi:hypothetical protein